MESKSSVIDLTSAPVERESHQDAIVIDIDDLKPAAASRFKRPRFSCIVCMEDCILLRDGISLMSCSHVFCKECLRSYVRSKIKDRLVRELVCLAADCRVPLVTKDIQACTLLLGDNVSWQAYQELATESFLETAAATESKILSLHRCPAATCNYLFEYSSHPDRGQRFDCPLCSQSFCLDCTAMNGRKVGPSHDRLSCAQVLQERKESQEQKRKLKQWQKLNEQADSRFRDLLAKEQKSGRTKLCPKCKVPITKNQGCDHMYCTVCYTHFNWSEA